MTNKYCIVLDDPQLTLYNAQSADPLETVGVSHSLGDATYSALEMNGFFELSDNLFVDGGFVRKACTS